MTMPGTRRSARRNPGHLGRMAVAIVSLICVSAFAQTAPDTDNADPPTRVGRLAWFGGEVSYSPAGDDQWVQAQVNRPIVTGDRLWADQGARAELSLDNGSWFLGALTSVTVSNLDDRVTQVQLQQGTLDVALRRSSPGAIVEIDTPNIAFSLTRAGRYRVDVDAEGNVTTVIVRSGAGVAYGNDVSYDVMPGQGYAFRGTDAHDNDFIAAPPYDEFDRWAAGRERRFEDAAAARYVSPEVVGYADLDTYGRWNYDPQYGNVWFPTTVVAGWAPYRYGHWAWIAPWGWTWVDDAPWGFAPFHYGRWVHVDRGWGWIPGPVNVTPCYAPALVAFVGGAGFGVAISSGPAIGWFPLGPREIYRPPYSVTRNYFRQVNVSNTVINNTTNITNIYNNYVRPGSTAQPRVNYVNMHAPNGVTAVPRAAFARAEPVNRSLVALPPAAVRAAQVEHVARVAPQRSAFTGAAPVTRASPPAAVEHRGVVARVAPPPPPVPISRQLPVLERNPGHPINHSEASALRRETPVATPPVRLVAPKPASNAARAPAPASAAPNRAPAGERVAPAPRSDTAHPPQERATPRPPVEQPAPRQPQERAAPRPPQERAPGPPQERAPRPPAEQQAPRQPQERAPRPPAEQAQRPQPPREGNKKGDEKGNNHDKKGDNQNDRP
ncbi:MAG TPA: DUF6600 domain-containing protein [Casimicrobiaceae bacterium]